MTDQEQIDKANAGDTGAAWDMILRRESENQDGTIISRSSRQKALPLRPPERRVVARRARRLAMVDPALLAVLGSLVAGEVPWPLYLFGPAGGGKTSAGLALCDVMETACYHPVDRLCDWTMNEPPAEMQEVWHVVGLKHLAVLDELGARERVGDLHYSVVKRFADERENRAGGVAVYIGNVRPEALVDLYDDRVASRVLCGTVFELAGKDRRTQGE